MLLMGVDRWLCVELGDERNDDIAKFDVVRR